MFSKPPGRVSIVIFFFAGLALLALYGCSSSVDNPSARVTDTISDVLQPGKISPAHPFVVSTRGELDIKLATLTPPFANPLVLLLGLIGTNGACSFTSQQAVLTGNNISYGLVDAGSYCVALGDSTNGVLTTNESFTLTVVHP